MKALVLNGIHQPLQYQDVDAPVAKTGEVLVELKAAALNHRDNWITKGLYRNIVTPMILGSDGAGTVAGRPVIINPNVNWGDNPRVPSANYEIIGMPYPGTFAERIVVGEDRLAEMPSHLTFEQAASLPLAGLTAFRTLFGRCQMQTGENVLVTGVGGGVALLACQFAIAGGANVYVTSSSEKKIAAAVEMGARGGANYKEDGWAKSLRSQAGGFDVIIDSAGGDGFADLIRISRPGARIGIYGGTRGTINRLSPQVIFFKHIDILGSSMGSDIDFTNMVAFVETHQIVPVVDSVFSLAEGNKALSRMDQGLQFGKIVLRNDN